MCEPEYYYDRPRKYKHPVCKGTSKTKRDDWEGKKRECPTCGRLIWSKMEFALHGDTTKLSK